MASSSDEKNKKNAMILQQNVFYHDIIRICKSAFLFYKEGVHHKQFLYDTIEFTHLFLEMLEEYSKGKVLTIKTHRKKKIKKAKKQRNHFYGDVDENEVERQKLRNQEDMDEDYNPGKPEDIDARQNEIVYEFEDDEIDYSGSEEEDGVEVNVER